MPLDINPADLPRAKRPSDGSIKTQILTGPIDIDPYGGGATPSSPEFQSMTDAITRAGQNLQLPYSAQSTGGGGGGGPLSDNQIALAARSAGFKGNDLVTAIAVALAESGGDPSSVYNNTDSHRSSDLGLFQINDYWNRDWLNGSFGDPFDPVASARMAYSIWSKRGWGDWVTYKKGRHQKFLQRAIQAAAGVS